MALLQSQNDIYEVIQFMGKGTFGEVMNAWKRGSRQLVAIKMLNNDSFRSHTIQNEIKLLKAIKDVDPDEHHIVKFIEYFYDEAKVYMVFELLHQSLFEYQKKIGFAPIPARHIRTITAQVLEALSKLKELSIIHADLKPENIMFIDQVKYPFKIKIIDFGSASIFSDVRYVKEPYIQTRFYRAPEILLGLPFCEKVDMWSLGCIIAELHLGWPLYPGNNEYDQVRFICETQGMPENHLLNAATKSNLFFKYNVDTKTQWKVKTVEEYQLERKVKPLTKRTFFKSLDQIASVNAPMLYCPDIEVLAECSDLKAMMELTKRMLTWDSHERITPNAALKHPFISLQQLRMNYKHARYYQLAQQCHNNAIKKQDKMPSESYNSFRSPEYYGNGGQVVKDLQDIGEIQRTIKQMYDLHIVESAKEENLKVRSEGTYHLDTPGNQDQTKCLHHQQTRHPVATQIDNNCTLNQPKVPHLSKSEKWGDKESRTINAHCLSS